MIIGSFYTKICVGCGCGFNSLHYNDEACYCCSSKKMPAKKKNVNSGNKKFPDYIKVSWFNFSRKKPRNNEKVIVFCIDEKNKEYFDFAVFTRFKLNKSIGFANIFRCDSLGEFIVKKGSFPRSIKWGRLSIK